MKKITEFIKFDKESTILYYDVPLLSLCVTPDNEYMFLIFCDSDEKYNTYAYAEMSQETTKSFILGDTNYFDALVQSNITLFDYDGNSGFNFRNIDIPLFMEKYGPEKDTDLTTCLGETREVFNDLVSNGKKHKI